MATPQQAPAKQAPTVDVGEAQLLAYPQIAHVGLENLPSPKDIHKRAAESSNDIRRTIITLATAAIGGLFWIVTDGIEPKLTRMQSHLIMGSIVMMAVSAAMGLWGGFADSQWSYWWAVELDDRRPQPYRDFAKGLKARWNKHKAFCERGMLLFFLLGILFAAVFSALRLYT